MQFYREKKAILKLATKESTKVMKKTTMKIDTELPRNTSDVENTVEKQTSPSSSRQRPAPDQAGYRMQAHKDDRKQRKNRAKADMGVILFINLSELEEAL